MVNNVFKKEENSNLQEKDGVLNTNKEIFVVIPAFNEEKTVGTIIEEIASLDYNVVLVDDGSKDSTYKIAKNSQFKYPQNIFVFQHIINRGVGAATMTGMNAALLLGAKYIVTFDADGQHAIEDIPKVCKPLINGETEVVMGARPFEDMPSSKSFANTVMNFITLIFYRVKVKDSQSGLKAFKADIVPKLALLSPGYAVCSEFVREIRRNHLSFEEVTITTIYTPETQAKGTNAIVGLKILVRMIIDLFR